MIERGILFSTPMVRALKEERKTQTRRVTLPVPPETLRHAWYKAPVYGWTNETFPAKTWEKRRCPYGYIGDRLWVRETFAILEISKNLDGEIDASTWTAAIPKKRESWLGVQYAADGGEGPWRPSIFMPRWASRFTLEITDVRVQRVREISQEDAKAEGYPEEWARQNGFVPTRAPVLWYADLWDSINAKRGFGWDVNPWVWAITFKRVDAQKEN